MNQVVPVIPRTQLIKIMRDRLKAEVVSNSAGFMSFSSHLEPSEQEFTLVANELSALGLTIDSAEQLNAPNHFLVRCLDTDGTESTSSSSAKLVFRQRPLDREKPIDNAYDVMYGDSMIGCITPLEEFANDKDSRQWKPELYQGFDNLEYEDPLTEDDDEPEIPYVLQVKDGLHLRCPYKMKVEEAKSWIRLNFDPGLI